MRSTALLQSLRTLAPCWMLWLMGLSMICSGGCSNDGKVEVEGTVTWNGQPLPTEGNIAFFYGDNIPAGKGTVIDGRFKFRCKPVGKVLVYISATKEIAPADRNNENQMPRQQYLPETYNLKSKLTAEVTAAGATGLTFPLVSSGN